MITLQFLAEWAVRSSALILGVGLLLVLARVKNPSVRLAAWTVVLCGSLAIPLIGPALPQLPLTLPAAIPIAVSSPRPRPFRRHWGRSGFPQAPQFRRTWTGLGPRHSSTSLSAPFSYCDC